MWGVIKRPIETLPTEKLKFPKHNAQKFLANIFRPMKYSSTENSIFKEYGSCLQEVEVQSTQANLKAIRKLRLKHIYLVVIHINWYHEYVFTE